MSKHFMLLAALACTMPAVASAQPAKVPSGEYPIVLWRAPDEYSIPGVGVVHTNDCYVNADGTLTARLAEKPRPWIYFYDRDGELEGSCEVLTVPRPIVVIREPKIHRAIGVIGR